MLLYCEVCGHQEKPPDTPSDEDKVCPNECGYLEPVSEKEVEDLEKARLEDAEEDGGP